MKKKLNEDVLLPGDIILTTGDSIVSKSIRTITRSDISHAMLYVNVCSVIHADDLGVHADNTQRLLFDESWQVYGLRLKAKLPYGAARAICDYTRKAVGTEYSVREALRVAAPSKTVSVKQFCSRLVAQAYSKQGYKIVGNPDFCSPGALLKSNFLEKIPNITRTVSDKEVSMIESIPDIPGKLTEATNKLLYQVRSIDPSVQTFSDLGRLVIEKRELDWLVRNLIMSSGYMDYKQHDETEYPWRYDIIIFEKMPETPGLIWYCQNTIKGEPRNDNRFTETLKNLERDNARWPRMTFKVMVDLYRHMAKMHALRVDTAEEWLRRRAARISGSANC